MKHTNCGNILVLVFSAILLLFLKLLFYGKMLVVTFSAILLLFQKIFDLRENASFAIFRKIAFS